MGEIYLNQTLKETEIFTSRQLNYSHQTWTFQMQINLAVLITRWSLWASRPTRKCVVDIWKHKKKHRLVIKLARLQAQRAELLIKTVLSNRHVVKEHSRDSWATPQDYWWASMRTVKAILKQWTITLVSTCWPVVLTMELCRTILWCQLTSIIVEHYSWCKIFTITTCTATTLESCSPCNAVGTAATPVELVFLRVSKT